MLTSYWANYVAYVVPGIKTVMEITDIFPGVITFYPVQSG